MDEKLQVEMDEFLPLRDVVFNTLRRGILTGTLKPGERLMEVHLANQLGVSRTPIREAIRKLELEGLVVMIPRRGAEVAKITEKSMQDVLEVRRALDVLSAELACERITPAEFDGANLGRLGAAAFLGLGQRALGGGGQVGFRRLGHGLAPLVGLRVRPR